MRNCHCRSVAVFLGALCLGLTTAFSPPTPAQAKTLAAKAPTPTLSKSKNVHPAIFASADDDAVHVTLVDGTALDAAIHPTSLFLQNGVAVSPTEFKSGENVILRTRTRASDGTLSVVMLCDRATAAAIEAYRRKPLLGNVVSMDDKTLVVQPGGATTMLTLRVTPKTLFRKGGADATAAAFSAGASVAVITRGLPSGLLMATIVSDTSSDAVSEKTALKPVSLVGTAVDVEPEKNILTVAPKTKPRQTVAVGDTTKIKVDKTEATLNEITLGMRVSARLGHQKDADGHLIATSLSAYPVAPKLTHKKVAGAKTP